MSTIKVEAGDLDKGAWVFSGMMGMAVMSKGFFTKVDLRQELDRIELLDEESVKRLTGTAGWGIAGAVLLGPLGALGGILLGGNKKEIAFAAYLKDGRKFMAVTDGKTWKKLLAVTF